MIRREPREPREQPREKPDWSRTQSFHEHRIAKPKGLVACGRPCYVSEHIAFLFSSLSNIMISDRLYRLLLSSGITFGGLGVAWILMKAIVPSKEEMLKVFTCEIFVSVH